MQSTSKNSTKCVMVDYGFELFGDSSLMECQTEWDVKWTARQLNYTLHNTVVVLKQFRWV